ncbi:2Fe-2S iron-sulfur cluster-binding protein [Mycobacterium sp. pUA109]|uniref:PDR/VanB family oxidoreductase n=1 Tax=Mycobacterium sp. pUA109 TaxID=3238982 RepID=UPI00351B3B1A
MPVSRVAVGDSGPQPSEVDLTLTVDQLGYIADDVVSLTLVDPDGHPLPAWEPGAHIDVLLDNSMVRQYSLCGEPRDRQRWRVAVRRDPDGRGGSVYLHCHMAAGARVRVRGPRNAFPLITRSRYLFIAGGIGITPLLPMIAAVARDGLSWNLLYGGRTRASMPFLETLAHYGSRVEVCPENERGLLDIAVVLDRVAPQTAVYCCGPEPLIAAVEDLASRRDDISLHTERFAPRAVATLRTDEPFEVYCAESDVTLLVPPGRSVLEVAADAGIDVLCSCKEGTCGTCEVDVLDGQPDHRDSFLSPQERASNETMLICVSRCVGHRLTLDL